MMRSLENVHLAVMAVERWDAEPSERIAEPPVAECFQQQSVERHPVVAIAKQACDASSGALRESERAVALRREDLAAPVDIQP